MEDKFTMSTGQAHELAMAFGRNGWTNADVKKLCGGDLLAHFLPVVRGQVEIASSKFPSVTLAADLIPEGWEIVEDVAPTLKSAGDLEFIPVFREGEPPVRGDVMRGRAKEQNANLGLADLKRALATQAEIPAELQDKYIVFAGTVLRDPYGGLYVVCLDWSGGRWFVGFGGVAGGWGSYARLARSK